MELEFGTQEQHRIESTDWWGGPRGEMSSEDKQYGTECYGLRMVIYRILVSIYCYSFDIPLHNDVRWENSCNYYLALLIISNIYYRSQLCLIYLYPTQ